MPVEPNQIDSKQIETDISLTSDEYEEDEIWFSNTDLSEEWGVNITGNALLNSQIETTPPTSGTLESSRPVDVANEPEKRKSKQSPPPSYENSILLNDSNETDEFNETSTVIDLGDTQTRTNGQEESYNAQQRPLDINNLNKPIFKLSPDEFSTMVQDSLLTTTMTLPEYNMSASDSKIFENCRTLEELFQRYEIGLMFRQKLECLREFKIVFVLDDSSSMKNLLDDSPLLKIQPRVARWNELQYFTNIAIQIATFYDPDGSDVYFLNKQPALRNCKSLVELNKFFKETRPKGFTPLTARLKNVLDDYSEILKSGGNLLTIVVTDGEPTDDRGNSDIKGFRKFLKSRPSNVYTNIVACTDQDDSMRYLNRMDRSLKNVDVVDDYRKEKDEVRKARGRRFQFTYGDYVCKAIIGSVDPTVDNMDQRRLFKNICRVS